MDLQVLALISTIVLVLIAVFLIPLLIQVRQTTQKIDSLVEETHREVMPLVRELRETTEYVRRISREAEADLVKVGAIFDSLEEAGEAVRHVAGSLNSGVSGVIGRSVGTWLGARAARKEFIREVKHHKGGK